MRNASVSLMCVIGILAGVQHTQAQSNVLSDPVGFYKIQINSSPSTSVGNLIAAPLHKVHRSRGLVSSITSSNVINLNGNPNFTVNEFAPKSVAAASFGQYIALCRRDASVPGGGPTSSEGDWWVIASNTANSLTVLTGSEDISTLLANGDQIEVRRLSSVVDLFGDPATSWLNKDSNGSASTTAEDVIRYVVGTGFGRVVLLHDGTFTGGTNRYLVNGSIALDPTVITFEPDEPVLLQRRANSPTTNVVSLGQVQTTKLSHYLLPAAGNAQTFINAFPANAPLNTSGLNDAAGLAGGSAWQMDSNASANQANEDVIRLIGGATGLSFTDSYLLHDGTFTGGIPTWLRNGATNNAFPLNPGKGYIVLLKTGTGARKWRQNVPFIP